MKNIISIFIITLMSSFCLTAQSNATKKADKHFNKFQFVEAAEDYLKLATDRRRRCLCIWPTCRMLLQCIQNC